MRFSILESMMVQVVVIVTEDIPQTTTNFEMLQETLKV
jgi:hypothetical protein